MKKKLKSKIEKLEKRIKDERWKQIKKLRNKDENAYTFPEGSDERNKLISEDVSVAKFLLSLKEELDELKLQYLKLKKKEIRKEVKNLNTPMISFEDFEDDNYLSVDKLEIYKSNKILLDKLEKYLIHSATKSLISSKDIYLSIEEQEDNDKYLILNSDIQKNLLFISTLQIPEEDMKVFQKYIR